MTDLFGVAGIDLLTRVELPGVYRGRIDSLRRLMDTLEVELDVFTGIVRARLSADAGYLALLTIPGIGPILTAVFIAEIGDVRRFTGPEQLACWCGGDPDPPRVRHSRSPRPDHQTGLAAGAVGGAWSRCRSCPRPAPWARSGTESARNGAATSGWSPPPANRSVTSTTRCVITTCAR